MNVVFRPEAEDDAFEARDYYDSLRAGLGRDFGLALQLLVTRIAGNPLIFPRVHGEIRRAVLSRFPYAVYFRLAGDVVVVLAVHGRQHPARWMDR